MMASKNGVGQIIKACVTGVTLIALPGGFRIIKAALDDLSGLTRWTCYAVWPAQLAYSLITLTIIDQILDVNLHRWTPVRVWDMGWYQCTPSSKSTTLESNMSQDHIRQAPAKSYSTRSCAMNGIQHYSATLALIATCNVLIFHATSQPN